MSEEAQPFTFNIHGTSDGRIYSFFYGIDREHLIEVLDKIINDYKTIESELKEQTTLEYKKGVYGN